jgi:S1 RNA binding domain protein
MDLVVGTILDGKVSGIMKFGAFVSLPGGKSGLVHISEIAYSYVNEVKDFLTEGQDVKVKVIGIDETGRINLSIKKAVERSPIPVSARTADRPPVNRHPAAVRSAYPREGGRMNQQTSDVSFEDKLKQFMQDSDNRMSGIKQYSDKKNSSARRNKSK